MRAGQEDTGNTHSTTCLCPFTLCSNVRQRRSRQTVAFVVLLLGYQPDAAQTPQTPVFLSNLDFRLTGLIWEGWRSWQRLGNWRSQVSRSFVPEGRSTCEVPGNCNRDALSLRKARAALQVSTLQIPKCTYFFKTLESFF